MEIIRRIKDWQQPWKTVSEPSRSTLLEVLEPRILLSADGLLNVIPSDQGKDMSLDSSQEVVQYAELLDTNEQFGEQIILELAPSDSPNTDFYQPIFTLSLDDCNANDESVDADLSIDNIGSAQTGEILLLSYDPNGDAESTIGITEDGSMPICINDGDLSIEYAKSIEIRGSPVGTGEHSTIYSSNTYVI